MKSGLTLLAILSTVCAAAGAQVAPATTAPSGLPLSGTLSYDLRYTQMAQFYTGTLGNSLSSAVSGDLTYGSLSQTRPFQLTYGGGDLWDLYGTSGEAGVFQHLLATQGFIGHKWALNFSNDVSYYQMAPITGFSGIPGVGSLPSQPGLPSQPVLTISTRTVGETVTSDYTQNFRSGISLDLNGYYSILRYPDGNGLDDNSWEAGPRVTKRLNAENSIFALYSISRFSYPDNSVSLNTQSVQFGLTRIWNQRFTTSVSAGPEWTTMPGSVVPVLNSTVTPPVTTNIALPSSSWLGASVNASAAYTTRTTTFTLSYIQATSAGGGVLDAIGYQNEDIGGGVTWKHGRNLTLSGTGGYMRSTALISGIELQLGLVQPGSSIDAEFGAATATRQLGRYLNLSANYTIVDQSYGSTLPGNAINGLSQMISCSIGYSPKKKHFER
ncbi:MAG: hypothetical protein ACP5FH_05160 [Terracidiphilus sp.]